MGMAQKEEIMEHTTTWEEQGIEKGLEQGVAQATQAIALNMLRQSMPVEMIAELTGLTIAQLQQLQNNPPQQ